MLAATETASLRRPIPQGTPENIDGAAHEERRNGAPFGMPFDSGVDGPEVRPQRDSEGAPMSFSLTSPVAVMGVSRHVRDVGPLEARGQVGILVAESGDLIHDVEHAEIRRISLEPNRAIVGRSDDKSCEINQGSGSAA
jgi:hypothetical protein